MPSSTGWPCCRAETASCNFNVQRATALNDAHHIIEVPLVLFVFWPKLRKDFLVWVLKKPEPAPLTCIISIIVVRLSISGFPCAQRTYIEFTFFSLLQDGPCGQFSKSCVLMMLIWGAGKPHPGPQAGACESGLAFERGPGGAGETEVR